MCSLETPAHAQPGEGDGGGTQLKSHESACCPGSKLTSCCYCYIWRYHGVWWPGDSVTTLEGMMRQEGDGICSYQPPSCSSKMFVYHTSRCQHARLWRAGTAGRAREGAKRPSYPCVAPTCRWTKLAVGRRLATFSPKVTE